MHLLFINIHYFVTFHWIGNHFYILKNTLFGVLTHSYYKDNGNKEQSNISDYILKAYQKDMYKAGHNINIPNIFLNARRVLRK